MNFITEETEYQLPKISTVGEIYLHANRLYSSDTKFRNIYDSYEGGGSSIIPTPMDIDINATATLIKTNSEYWKFWGIHDDVTMHHFGAYWYVSGVRRTHFRQQ